MINKSKLWFLTLSSIILVLAVYYIAIPQDSTDMVFSSNTNSGITTTIEESEALTAMRITKEEEHLESIQTLQEILLDGTKTIDEKNEAYEQIKYLNTSKSIEEKLEKEINKSFSINCFVQIKDSTIKVVIANADESYKLANDIITYVNKETNNSYFVTIKFEWPTLNS